ncbi:hypothetical protein [Paenalkalicoccus suaedae]|nr:hypothetical protein [Paenalkalicoccus suaedae]
MFKINYRIVLEENEDISTMDIKSFNEQVYDIYGQFEIVINELHEGYVDDCLPFGIEIITFWLRLLNQAAIALQKKSYVAFWIPETDSFWIEMTCKENTVLVRIVELIKYSDVLKCHIISEHHEVFKNKTEFTSVSKEEVINEIKRVTQTFIKDIEMINDNLLSSEVINEIIELNKQM